MSKILAFLSLLAGLILMLALGVLSSVEKIEENRSVGFSGEYNYSTTTRDHAGTALTSRVLKTGPGALSSIQITGANTGIINFYDATSTVTNSEWATTTLASIPASAAAEGFVFNASFVKGLYVEVVGLAPTSTITWK